MYNLKISRDSFEFFHASKCAAIDADDFNQLAKYLIYPSSYYLW